MQIRIKNKTVRYLDKNYIHKQDLLSFIEICTTEIKNRTNKPIRTFRPKYRQYLTIGDILMGVSQSFVKEA